MPELAPIGKVVLVIGAAVVVLGLFLIAADRIPGLGGLFSWMGKLPGDLSYKRENFSWYVPLATSLVLSVLLSLLFYFIGWFFRR